MSITGDEEEDEECFYESLDRILSSSHSSTSSSAVVSEDDEPSNSPNYASDHPPFPRFPTVVSKYDVWIAEPSSIEERRKRLLREMGLSGDRSLSRLKSSNDPNHQGGTGRRTKETELFGRSVSADRLPTQQHQDASSLGNSNSGIVRSKSDGSADCTSSLCPPPNTDHYNSSTFSSTSIHSIYSIQSVGNSVPLVHNPLLSKSRSSGSNGSPNANVAPPNKPPTGKPSRRVENFRSDPTNINPSPNFNSMTPVSANAGTTGREFDDDSDYSGNGKVPDQFCTIKNLDNGKEFIVNEFSEDGMWNKLREVGTGRQLTREEFEMCVGHSPIVQELMRRQNVDELNVKNDDSELNENGSAGGGSKSKKKGSWFRSIKNVASTVTGQWERRSSDERDTSSEKGGRRSSSATDDSQDVTFHGPERVRVRQYGKSCKELSALYKSQEIQAHTGSIWSIKFSLDGRYLASAGEDCVIHIWQVQESERKGDLLLERPEDGILNPFMLVNGSPEPTLVSSSMDNHLEKRRRARTSISRKSISLDQVIVPETVFALSERPICTFRGHLDDVLDLSWSKSQYLLSSSMDKTVRLWHMSSNCCLKTFSHSDYVTCIHFNPVDDRFFISGSLDNKVRMWSIPDRQVVDWKDLHEMVTAACYTPDGQGALVGSYKGSCYRYNTSGCRRNMQLIYRTRKRNPISRRSLVFSLSQGVPQKCLLHLQIHEYGLLRIRSWFTNSKGFAIQAVKFQPH
uniref:WD repeat-containing protein 44-like n=1 Tax=Nelumbo nucifera TaxID=4432 RepID=A0A822XZY4_NELNU|nr:TPA_asm: hypothetical protein HUJ06_024421 [Nelumbo nucifera]